jgi:CheY-like chemotaxis protein
MEVNMMNLLLIEDNLADVVLIQKFFKKNNTKVSLETITDGTEAMVRLFDGTKLPDLILLDLNLPGYSGQDILARIKTTARTKLIPVVVLTSSKQESDLLAALQCAANAYVVKPDSPETFEEMIVILRKFWVEVASLP